MMYQMEMPTKLFILERMGISPRQRTSGFGSQSIFESQSNSDMRQQEESDGFDNPFSTKRLTEVPIGEFYLRFRDEILLIASTHLIELREHLRPLTMYNYRLAVGELTEEILSELNDYQSRESSMFKSLNEMKNGFYLLTFLKSDEWLKDAEYLDEQLEFILHKQNRFSLCPELTAELCNLLIEKLDFCLREHLSQLRLLYKREFLGIWWKFYRMYYYGFPLLRQTDHAKQHGFFFLMVGFYYALHWFDSLWIEKDFVCLLTVVAIADIIIYALLLSISDGKLAFYFCSFHPSVRPLYDHATSCIAWAESNWPSSKVGSEFTWRFWKKQTDGYVPRAGPYTDVEYKGNKYD
ncbi:hypothetical protein PUMCH_002279 [Australozyma saopauloensis]|uniref:Uncharacterized protein n=1 Tax=Australozyma saopauloensis TaxID=291208 RepID=A0AAX4H8V5_9ASCO|nr:hypothetical protein PUMCH_002279 [[Candida] saopauloensis]